jgi:hypothetical protein
MLQLVLQLVVVDGSRACSEADAMAGPSYLIRSRGFGPTVQQAPLPVAAEPEVDQYDQLIREQLERLNAPRKSMYTPEQVQQRRDANEREYQMGLLGALSGDSGMGEVGGLVLKNALAQRQPKVTERGVSDPISGEFTYDPDYLNERHQQQLLELQKLKASSLDKRTTAASSEALRRDLANQHDRTLVLLKSMGNGGGGLGVGTATQVGADDTANPVFRTKDGRLFKYGPDGQPIAHTGALLPKPSNSVAGEDERKAAQWLIGADVAWGNMQKVMKEDPESAQTSTTEKLVNAIPRIGPDMANVLRTPDRQKFIHASSMLKEALLRAATGAGYNLQEAKDAVEMVTPIYGEHAETTKQKMDYVPQFLEGLRTRAGRAAPKGPPTTPAATAPTAATGTMSAAERAELEGLRKRFPRSP